MAAAKKYTIDPSDPGDDRKVVNLISSEDPTARAWRLLRGHGKPWTMRQWQNAYYERFGDTLGRSRVQSLIYEGWAYASGSVATEATRGKGSMVYKTTDHPKAAVKRPALIARTRDARRRLLLAARACEKARYEESPITIGMALKAIERELRSIRNDLYSREDWKKKDLYARSRKDGKKNA